MNIEIVEKNYDVGARLQGLIEKKVGKLEKYFGKGANCKVVCKKEGNMFKLEISISAKNWVRRYKSVSVTAHSPFSIHNPCLHSTARGGK